VISVDTKKKELVMGLQPTGLTRGDFRNNGREYRPQGCPEEVRVHDFLIEEFGRAVPYGVYDLAANAGWVSVGFNHDTAAFTVDSIRQWCATSVGRATQRHPIADHGQACPGESRGWRQQWLAGTAVEERTPKS
jgi:hypothetical protein